MSETVKEHIAVLPPRITAKVQLTVLPLAEQVSPTPVHPLTAPTVPLGTVSVTVTPVAVPPRFWTDRVKVTEPPLAIVADAPQVRAVPPTTHFESFRFGGVVDELLLDEELEMLDELELELLDDDELEEEELELLLLDDELELLDGDELELLDDELELLLDELELLLDEELELLLLDELELLEGEELELLDEELELLDGEELELLLEEDELELLLEELEELELLEVEELVVLVEPV